jgi:hypothetical protein
MRWHAKRDSMEGTSGVEDHVEVPALDVSGVRVSLK